MTSEIKLGDPAQAAAAKRYGQALFELAEAKGAVEDVERGLDAFVTMLGESEDLRGALANPAISAEAKTGALRAVADKAGLPELVTNFLAVAAANRRAGAIPGAAKAFKALAAAKRGARTAEVTSAAPLSDAEQAALKESLKKTLGSDVDLALKVDPGILGGLIVQVGSRMFDDSIRSQLARLELAMKEAP